MWAPSEQQGGGGGNGLWALLAGFLQKHLGSVDAQTWAPRDWNAGELVGRFPMDLFFFFFDPRNPFVGGSRVMIEEAGVVVGFQIHPVRVCGMLITHRSLDDCAPALCPGPLLLPASRPTLNFFF